jgi:short-subunit dehydrogenase
MTLLSNAPWTRPRKADLQIGNAADAGSPSANVKDGVGGIVVVGNQGVVGCIEDMDMESPATAGRVLTAAARPAALITGASSGIGAALAHVFAQNGHEVVLTARRAPQMANVASNIRAAGHRAHTISCDLSRRDSSECIAREMAALNLEPSFIVNNAGYGLLGPAATLDRGDQLAMIDLNCRTLTELSLRFIPSLARHRGGILNVASISGFIPGPGMSVYNASKAYVLSFSVGLRRELQPKGIRVTTLCPGPVPTEFQARAGILDVHYPRGFDRPAEDVAREGYKGLMRNRAVVVPGLHNKLVPWLPRFLPRSFIASMVYGRLRRWEDA